MKKKALMWTLGLALVLSTASASPSLAQEERPDEGQITKVDQDAKMITVKDELGDEWELFWADWTRSEGTADFLELRPGDYVQFQYKDMEGRKVITDIRRSSKARWLKLVDDMSRLA